MEDEDEWEDENEEGGEDGGIGGGWPAEWAGLALSTRRAGSSLKGSGRKLNQRKLMAGTTVMRMLGALMAYS